MDFEQIVYAENPEEIIALLKTFVDPNKDWSIGSDNQPLSGEQLVAIWLEEKKKLNREQMKMNTVYSDRNTFKFICAQNEEVSSPNSWIENIIKELSSPFPNKNVIGLQLEGTLEQFENNPESQSLVDELIGIKHEEGTQEAIQCLEDILKEDLEFTAINFIFEKTAQENQEQTVSKQQLIQEITAGEDLTKTDHGQMEKLYSDVIEEAKSEANRFINVSDKEILSCRGTSSSEPYGVAETDLQRKIIKQRLIEKINGLSDPVKFSEAKALIDEADKQMSENKIVAFRINLDKIDNTVNELMSEVSLKIQEMKNIPEQQQFASEYETRLEEMKRLTLTLAVGSVIVHEAEHTEQMTAKKGDPRGEAGAVSIENRFIDTMLQDPKYELIRPFIARKGKPSQQTTPIVNEPDNMNNEEIKLTSTSSSKGWYRL